MLNNEVEIGMRVKWQDGISMTKYQFGKVIALEENRGGCAGQNVIIQMETPSKFDIQKRNGKTERAAAYLEKA